MTIRAKIIVVGGFGVGKTQFVDTVSEIDPLTTEEALTKASVSSDKLADRSTKTTTTVAMDFGRRTIDDSLTLYLFGFPGQARFEAIWHKMAERAVAAVLLVDTRDIASSWQSVEFLLNNNTPFIVVQNVFFDSAVYSPGDITTALRIDHSVPVVTCDARDLRSSAGALAAVVNHVLRQRRQPSTFTP